MLVKVFPVVVCTVCRAVCVYIYSLYIYIYSLFLFRGTLGRIVGNTSEIWTLMCVSTPSGYDDERRGQCLAQETVEIGRLPLSFNLANMCRNVGVELVLEKGTKRWSLSNLSWSTQEEWVYSSAVSLNLATDRGGGSTPCPGRCTPGKDSVSIV